MKIPYRSGEWKLLFQPQTYGTYVNDHSVIQANDGKWHLFGITSHTGGSYNEKYFVHAVGDSLDEPLKEIGKVIDRGTLAWAPCVMEKDDNYFMFYGPSPTQMAVSFDLTEWYNYPVILKNEPFMAAHRDHFILKVGNEYLMYVTGVHDKKGAISLFTSTDLVTWEFEGFALTSGEQAPLRCGWGAMESPFVVEKDGWYYLFITYTTSGKATYNDTLVFASKDAKRFGEYNGGVDGAIPITKLFGHASEIIKVGDEYYMTTCGWKDRGIPHEGGVSIAPILWK